MVTGRRFFRYIPKQLSVPPIGQFLRRLGYALLAAIFSIHAQSLELIDTLHATHFMEKAEALRGTIHLQNAGDELLKVKAYVRDYALKVEPFFPEPGTTPRSNATWIELPYAYFEIPPYTSFIVYYELKVPDDADLQGSYWSVIMLESSENVYATSSEGKQIPAIRRLAYQVVAEVGDRGTHKISILDKRVEVSLETKYLVFDVENTGSLTLKLKPSIELLDLEGKSLGVFSSPWQLLHPLFLTKFVVDLSTIQPGNYRAQVFFKHNDDRIFGTQYQIDVPDFLPKIPKKASAKQ